MGEVVDISRNKKRSNTPNGLAQIQFIAHSTAVLTTEKGKRIIIDPWLDGNPRCPEELKGISDLDAIILTHGHSDHCGSVLDLAEKCKVPVYAIFELANLLVEDGLEEGLVEPMGKGGTVELRDGDGVKIHLTTAIHSSSYTKKDGTTHYSGEPCGVVVELESGRTLYHAGDTALYNDMSLIQEKFSPEIAMLPIGDRFTMGPLDAARAAQLIKPKVAVPIHFDTFDLLTGTSADFEKFLLNSETQVVVLKPGENISF